MGCSSCSTSTGDTSPGCKNNGTCGTSGCNKLNVYNWLADMELPQGEKPYNIVEIRFKGSRKEFFRNSEYLELKTGDMVAVEGNPGHDIGTVSIAGELVRFQLKKKGVTEDSDEIKALYRLARPADVEKFNAVKALEVETMYRARSIALSLNLRMKLSDVEYQGDGKKATFFYTAEERVDFRELIKKLAEEFKVRIEMRQIGMRQEASRLGGIGSCGRELCCSTWLTDFKVVSTSAARYQNLSLNPLKLAGQCGKLKCCLNYELDSYLDAISDIPDSNSRLETKKGYALHRKTDIFKRMMWFAYVETGAPGEFVNSDNWIALSVDRVKEVISMNKQGEKPVDLNDYVETTLYEKPLDYADVVGQDSLTRMMEKKGKKKKKKGGADSTRNAGPTQPKPSGQQQDRFKNKNRTSPDSSATPSQQQKPNVDNAGERNERKPLPPRQNQEQRPPRQLQENKPQNNPSQQTTGQGNRPERKPTSPTTSTEVKPPAPQQQSPVTQVPKLPAPPASTNPSSVPPSGSESSRPQRIRQAPPKIDPPKE
ncbi:MAG: hypothetical protein IPL74_04625 [Bacteroidetes bacterium]|nr:hypothetical protein [Bacteroidota bacterium]